MNKTRLQISKKDILSYIDSANRPVFKYSELEEILTNQRSFWRLSQRTSTKDFIRFLIESGYINISTFEFPKRKEFRYIWKNATDYEIVQSLREKSYFSHFTAMFLHGLTIQLPKTIYLNFEQPKKKIIYPELTQSRIDAAFKKQCRVSKTIAKFDIDKRVCILNGKYTDQLGVSDLIVSKANIKATNIERTLIDISIRPIYSGGVFNVLEAFKAAAEKVSINKLVSYLLSMQHIYPYHQVIGFYLEKSGLYSDSQISLLDKFEKKFQFYLAHQINDKEYSERWNIYYPRGL